MPAGVQIENRENLWLPLGEIPLEETVRLKSLDLWVVDEATSPSTGAHTLVQDS